MFNKLANQEIIKLYTKSLENYVMEDKKWPKNEYRIKNNFF